MTTRIIAILGSLALALSSAAGKNLSFSIRSDPRTVRPGQRVTFTFVYTNTTDHPIGIIPEYNAYEALDVHLKKLDGSGTGKMVPYFSPHIDPDLARKNFKLLKPGQTYTRTLTALFGRSLPDEVAPARRTPGLYLLFADSAIRLPDFGKYKATSRYLGIESYKNDLPERYRRWLWVGEMFSPPIAVQFAP